MKKWLLHTLMLLAVCMSACTPKIYGVPQDRWETMSEQERIAAMDAYKARQEVLRQQREEQARLRAMEKEAQQDYIQKAKKISEQLGRLKKQQGSP